MPIAHCTACDAVIRDADGRPAQVPVGDPPRWCRACRLESEHPGRWYGLSDGGWSPTRRRGGA
ncbi:hypothetical protein [Streptomyces barkulensis]|uniref:hypothetical protein n=1 Tax=Streptomyces barkulensis TaxID=1257026 RepID=UPI001304616B|nr:hypothetical protein [Streptomyces barkulensis]